MQIKVQANADLRQLDAALPARSGELDELVLAYATTIHKSQGSEYPAVIIPVTTEHYTMLARNLLYTGVTRGKKLVVLVGQNQGLLAAVIDADVPEQADATAQALAQALSNDHAHFTMVRRPDASPYFRKEGLLLRSIAQLTDLLDRTIDAQPFLGKLAADPTARGLFSALSLLGQGVTHGDANLRRAVL